MTTESKHSPGPWFWDDKDALPWTDYDETIHAPFLMDANGSIVMSGDGIRIRNEADGQLMIAAPEVLAALKTLVSLGSLELPHQRDAAINTALAAIAKAERRSV